MYIIYIYINISCVSYKSLNNDFFQPGTLGTACLSCIMPGSTSSTQSRKVQGDYDADATN